MPKYSESQDILPWFFSGKGMVSLSLLSRFFISVMSLEHRGAISDSNCQFHRQKKKILFSSSDYSPLDVLNVCGHQEVCLRTVRQSGWRVFQDWDVRAVLFLTFYLCSSWKMFSWKTCRETSLTDSKQKWSKYVISRFDPQGNKSTCSQSIHIYCFWWAQTRYNSQKLAVSTIANIKPLEKF